MQDRFKKQFRLQSRKKYKEKTWWVVPAIVGGTLAVGAVVWWIIRSTPRL